MSVTLTSKNRAIEHGSSNGGWAAIVAHARAFDSKIPAWDGYHDGQEWTPDQLIVMADRLEQSARVIPILRALAANGGAILS